MKPPTSHTLDRSDELCERLAIASRLLTGDIAALAGATRAPFALHLPRMQPPEEEILRMLLFEARSVQQIAASLDLSETDVFGWAALGLVRLLSDMPIHAMLALHT
jgi:hypothetical protein